MLSSKARYALRALVELARAPGAQITAGDLAERADAPRKFLEAILLELSRRGVVVSRRGKLGGYSLARPAADISFAEVIRVIDGPLAMAPCTSSRLSPGTRAVTWASAGTRIAGSAVQWGLAAGPARSMQTPPSLRLPR